MNWDELTEAEKFKIIFETKVERPGADKITVKNRCFTLCGTSI